MPLYLWINIILIAITIAFSFTKKVGFYKNYIYVLPAIIIPCILFIIWDYFFIQWGVWGFVPGSISGIYWFGIPMEQSLFLLTMPFFGLFIHALLGAYIKKDILISVQKLLTTFFLLLTLILFFAFAKHIYTSISALICAFTLLCRSWIARPKSLGRFFLSYFVTLIPFIIIRIILANQNVIWFDEAHIIGIKIINIPVEDIIYFLALFLLNVGIYEYAKRVFVSRQSTVVSENEMKE